MGIIDRNLNTTGKTQRAQIVLDFYGADLSKLLADLAEYAVVHRLHGAAEALAPFATTTTEDHDDD